MEKEINTVFTDLGKINGFVHVYKNVVYIILNKNMDFNLLCPIMKTKIDKIISKDIQEDFTF